MHAKKGELTFMAFLSLFSFLLLVTVLLIAFNSFSVRENPQDLIKDYSDLSITGNAITGKATYNGEVLTVSDIEQGITLSAGWNTFVWPTDEYDVVSINDAFDSILSRLHFAYDYDNQEYWFNPNGQYAAYNTHNYYSTILFDEIEPGVQYGVYLAEPIELQYNFPRAGLNKSGGSLEIIPVAYSRRKIFNVSSSNEEFFFPVICPSNQYAVSGSCVSENGEVIFSAPVFGKDETGVVVREDSPIPGVNAWGCKVRSTSLAVSQGEVIADGYVVCIEQ